MIAHLYNMGVKNSADHVTLFQNSLENINFYMYAALLLNLQ